MNMQHVLERVAFDITCIMDMDMLHRHDLQYGHEHAAWKWTRSKDLVIQHVF
jgi:hypothetical protein